MLTQDELKTIKDGIVKIEDEIRSLTDQKRDLRQKLVTNALEIVDAKFPGLNPGDKVRVTYQTIDWWSMKPKGEVTEVLYFQERNVSGNWSVIDASTKDVYYNFFLVKKDGTPSKRRTSLWFEHILSIEKVTE